ncbi:uncharacterized protein LOC108148993 [Drosophila elegans]|uniref:uncharacterized protein LOC108148993 n=1 Tax=Drosophila elegans TaxID=30023 RepID=UPI0007E7C48F|nr:uncharacterized protein LOC108148993 [Drosophila elegans]
MHDLHNLLLSLSLFFFVGAASTACIIPEDQLNSKNVYLSGSNGNFDIQRGDIVATGQSVHLLCAEGIYQTAFVCQNNVFNPPLSTSNCARGVKASVKTIIDSSCPSPYLTYAVGIQEGTHFFELYRNCFDGQHLALQHSIYKAYRYIHSALRPAAYFTTDGIMTVAQASAYMAKKYRACLSPNLGAGQQNCELDRGHMTPSSAFIFKEFRKSTDKYLNVVPQNKLVNIGNWKNIEAWVNNLVMGRYDTHSRTYDVLKVCTGALRVHELSNNNRVPLYLLGDKIPVPKWTYKIVGHLSGDKWVILTYNDVNPPSRQDLNQICTTTNCHPNLNLNGVGYTVCCNPYDFILRNINHLSGIC